MISKDLKNDVYMFFHLIHHLRSGFRDWAQIGVKRGNGGRVDNCTVSH